MDELLSEKEQLEALRGWWQENGRYIVSGVVLGVALLIGLNYWNKQKEQAATQASALYESLVLDIDEIEVEEAEATATRLYENYGGTVYAPQSRLAMAKLYMSVGRDEDAADELRAVLAQDDDSELQMVARLRLAKILLYQEKLQDAVDLLQGYRNSAFAARYNEALGDAYAELERFAEAREAYAAALADNPQAPTVDRRLIQMKINDLPLTKLADAQAPEEPAAEADDGDAAATDTPAEANGEAPASDAPAEADE